MLLTAIEEINPEDPFCKKLAEIASAVGIMDMRQAFMLIEPYMHADGQTVMLAIDASNYLEMMRFFLAMAIFNYACFVHERFEVPAMEVDMAMKFSRKYPVESCEKMVSRYLQQFFTIGEKYGW